VIDFRIYRAGFAPALAAVIVLLFALTAPPDPLPGVVAPAEFDELAAARIARQIVETAPEPTPGSDGDAAIADLVEQRFTQVDGGSVSEQRFTGEFAGDQVDLRNLILTLPGESARTVVLLAPRDSASGPGAASSAAATATLLELVDQLSTQSHTKTLVFVSTDGSSAGAQGAREFAQSYPQRDEIEAAIDIWQPGSANPRQPFVLDSSDASQSPSAQLVRTAERELSDQTQSKLETQGTFGELTALALPSGLGEQAVLIENGLDAVGLSSAGERPVPASQDQPEDLSTSTLGDFGRTALLLAATVDAATAPPEHGPDTYIPLAGNLVPGWTLALLALALLLPAALAAGDGIQRGVRAHAGTGWAIGWAASRALPLLAGLLFFYFLSAVGLVASPTFPFDPNLFGVGAGQIVVMVLVAIVISGSYCAIRGWRAPAVLPTSAAVPALGAVSTLAVFLAWLANPYLALFLVPTAHVWLTCAPRRGSLRWPLVLGAAALSLVPLAAAVAHLSGSLALGSAAPWLLLLMVSDGQFGFGTMLALCLVIGGLLGIGAVSLRRPAPPRRPAAQAVSQGPAAGDGAGVPEPESVGSPTNGLDTSPITSPGPGDDLRSER
jgi:Peptidase family M28